LRQNPISGELLNGAQFLFSQERLRDATLLRLGAS
jgi:hypothetical protein